MNGWSGTLTRMMVLAGVMVSALVSGACSQASLVGAPSDDESSHASVREVPAESPRSDQARMDSDAGNAAVDEEAVYDAEEGAAEPDYEAPALAESASDALLDRDAGLAVGAEAKPGDMRGRRYALPAPPEAPRRREPPADMRFRDYGVNPWEDVLEDNLSTFAMDVDTGSYTIARRYLLDGLMPPMEAVRTEEFVNYFDQDYPEPERGAFAIHMDGAPSPFGEEGEQLVRVGIQGREVRDRRRKDAVLTFVVDVSGSMDMENRLELVKDAVGMLVDELGEDDSIAIVAYTDDAWVVLEPTPADDRRRIRAAIRELRPMDSTNAEAGLTLGYDLAEASFRRDAINRVILCSDGVANVGATGPDQILRRIGRSVERGITLTSIGVGMGNYNDELMEQLADAGDGAYYYVDDRGEAERIFVDNLTGTLQLIARDAKAQVEFNPEVVDYYRLIGYENRDLADREFYDDDVDAGEIGSGHSVTALYAVMLRPRADGEIATATVRYEDPDEGNVRETEATLDTDTLEKTFRRADPRFRLTASAAAFAEILRDSYYNRETTLAQVIDVAEDAADDLRRDADAEELVELMRAAEGLVGVAYGYDW